MPTNQSRLSDVSENVLKKLKISAAGCGDRKHAFSMR
jgi:hypothetical protein